MQDKTTDTNANPASERRAWEAPRLTTLVPVERTEGGAFSIVPNEGAGAFYTPS